MQLLAKPEIGDIILPAATSAYVSSSEQFAAVCSGRSEHSKNLLVTEPYQSTRWLYIMFYCKVLSNLLIGILFVYLISPMKQQLFALSGWLYIKPIFSEQEQTCPNSKTRGGVVLACKDPNLANPDKTGQHHWPITERNWNLELVTLVTHVFMQYQSIMDVY